MGVGACRRPEQGVKTAVEESLDSFGILQSETGGNILRGLKDLVEQGQTKRLRFMGKCPNWDVLVRLVASC